MGYNKIYLIKICYPKSLYQEFYFDIEDLMFTMKKINWKILSLLFLFFFIGLIFRVYNLDERGLATDETEKMLAAKNYLKFSFFHDVEHPMLMKEMCALSILFFGETETALRLPNTIFGALTCIPIFLLAKILFDKKVALLSSLLWALNINAISFNRTAKEDTLVVFFGILFLYCYFKIEESPKYYYLASIFVGLTFASKYISFPIVIIWFFYSLYLLRKCCDNFKSTFKNWLKKIIFPFSAIFLIVNPIFVFPRFWSDLFTFFTTQYSDHTGYYAFGSLKESLPFYFIPLYFFAKTQIVFLIFLLIGLIFMIKRRNENDNFLLLCGIIIGIAYSIPVFFSRFTRYVMPIIPGIVIVQAIGIVAVSGFIIKFIEKKSHLKVKNKHNYLSIFIILLILFHPTLILISNSPYYSIYVNEIGGGNEKEGYYFPHCSYYDWGMREAVFFINENAEYNSTIAAIEDEVFNYYKNEDLNYFSMQQLPEDISTWGQKYNINYVIVQFYRIYNENIDKIDELETNYEPVKEIRVNGKIVINIYKL